MSIETLFAIIITLLLATLVLILRSWKSSGRKGFSTTDKYRIETINTVSDGTNCPLCGGHLPRGVRVHSILFPGKHIDLMHIYGCPYCWEDHPVASEYPRHSRRCPYCLSDIQPGGYVIARVYRRINRKPHVQVFCCTSCQQG